VAQRDRKMQRACPEPFDFAQGRLSRRGTLPPSNWKATSPVHAKAGVRPAVGVATAFRRKTSPRPRVFRMVAPVVVGESGAAGGVRLCEDYRGNMIHLPL